MRGQPAIIILCPAHMVFHVYDIIKVKDGRKSAGIELDSVDIFSCISLPKTTHLVL